MSFSVRYRTLLRTDLADTLRVGAHVLRAADGDDAGQARGHLVQRNAMNVRMEPEMARRMVGGDLDRVVHGTIRDIHVGMAVGRMAAGHGRRTGDRVGGIAQFDEDVVAVRVARPFRTMRLDDQPMGVQVGRIADQQRIVGDMVGFGDRRQLVHQADLQCVARIELQPHTAQRMRAAGRTGILHRAGAGTDLIDPCVGGHAGGDRCRDSSGDQHQIKRTALTGEHGRIAQWGGGTCGSGESGQHQRAQSRRNQNST